MLKSGYVRNLPVRLATAPIALGQSSATSAGTNTGLLRSFR